jgi:hypothetical protein
MSAVERALARLAEGGVLTRTRDGAGFGVVRRGDRRRSYAPRLTEAQVRELESAGAIAGSADGFVLTEAGRARVRRQKAELYEPFIAQHGKLTRRPIVRADGDADTALGFELTAAIRRLAALRDGAGAPWLTAEEITAAARLRADWERSQIGLVRGSDWTAPPKGGAARGAGNAQERALAAQCDARRRVADALEKLAPPLRRVVERVCLHEQGLEMMERAECWPQRSGKLALKLGLAQLAQALR